MESAMAVVEETEVKIMNGSTTEDEKLLAVDPDTEVKENAVLTSIMESTMAIVEETEVMIMNSSTTEDEKLLSVDPDTEVKENVVLTSVTESTMAVVEETEAKIMNSSTTEDEKLLAVDPDIEVKEIAVLTESKKMTKKKNQIQVSNTKKPFFYYYNLAKRFIKQYNEVELSGLGMAIPTVVTIAEILKKNGLAIEKKLMISSVCLEKGENDRLVMKPKIEIALVNEEKIKKITTVMASSQDCSYK